MGDSFGFMLFSGARLSSVSSVGREVRHLAGPACQTGSIMQDYARIE